MTIRFAGAVLTGGASRRMGTDKALVPVGGVAMAERVVRTLAAAGATEVTCIGGDRLALDGLGLSVIEDEWPGEGPLGGLVTALGWSGEPAIVVAGCDQPWLDLGTIELLVEAHGAGDAAVTVYRVDDRPQPLPGVYAAHFCSPLADALAGGERSLMAALRLAGPTIVDPIDPATLRDVDRPEDLPSETLAP